MLALTGVVMAQTEWKDRYVSIARNHQLNPAIAYPTQSGSTVTVWEDERDVELTGSDIYIQRIDNGTGVNQWIGDVVNNDVVTDRFDGIAVCKAEYDQRNPSAAYDGMGGVVVVWEDYRNDPTNTVADIYAQRIVIATGRRDPAWPIDGIPVCQTGFHNERPRIVGTVDGAFITWIDYRNDPGSPPRDRDVFVQYIQSATASWPPQPTNWVANGISVARNQVPDQINPELASDNIFALDFFGNMTQGVIVTYQDNRYNGAFSGQPVWTVFANRIDANGVQMYTMGTPPWAADVAAGPSNENQEYPRIVTTGKNPNVTNQSAVIVWQDMIDDPAQGWTDIYAQCLDQVGMPQFPGPNGLMVCQASSSQILPQPTLWESGDPLLGTYIPYVTVGWLDYRNYAQSGIDIYGGLIDARAPGMMMNPAGPAGEPLCVLPYDQTQLSMDNVKYNSQTSEQTVFVWTHPTGAGMDIREQKIAIPPWIEAWPVNGWPVTEAKSDQILPQANREVFVWQDGRRDPIPNDNQDDENIYCQTPGMCTGPTEMNWRDMFAKWTFGNDADHFRQVSDPEDGSTFIVWDEVRSVDGTDKRIVFAQKLDKDGIPRWSNNGVAVNNYNNTALPLRYSVNAKLPDICVSGDRGAYVIWQQTDAGYGEVVFAAIITADGNPIIHPSGLNQEDGYTIAYCYEPRIVKTESPDAAAVFGAIQYLHGTATWQAVISGWRNNAALSQFGPISSVGDFATPLTELIIACKSGPYAYALVNHSSGSQLHYGAVVLQTPTPSLPYMSGISYVSFGGFDMAVQQTSPYGKADAALIAYSTRTAGLGSPYFEINLALYRPGYFMPYLVTANINTGDNSKYPTIVADSSVFSSSQEEGALITWDTEYRNPPITGPFYHKVESNRYRFNNALEFGPNHLTLDAGLSQISYPDIARMINPIPAAPPHAFSVWEGGGESSACTPPRPIEIYGQYANYDAGSMSAGIQWSQPTMVAPGSGNYFQTKPQVTAGLPGEASVYWYDTQNGNTGVMGTRLSLFDRTAIHWMKARTESDRSLPSIPSASIDGVWPQPPGDANQIISIAVHAVPDANVRLDLYDLLGRKISTLYQGMMPYDGMVVQFSPADHILNPGVYILRLNTFDQQVVKTIILNR